MFFIHYQLSILGPGELFGVEELLSGKPRSHTVVCISQTGLVLEIKKKEAHKLIFSEAAAHNWLTKYLASKTKLHNNRLNNLFSYTKNVKNFLMRAQPNSNTNTNINTRAYEYEKSSERVRTNPEPEVPHPIRYYRTNSPVPKLNSQEIHESESLIGTKNFTPLESTERNETRSKEISPKKWQQNGWSHINRPSLNEALESSIANMTPNANLSLTKQSSVNSYSPFVTTTRDGLTPKLSITEKLLKEHKQRTRITRDRSQSSRSKSPTKFNDSTHHANNSDINSNIDINSPKLYHSKTVSGSGVQLSRWTTGPERVQTESPDVTNEPLLKLRNANSVNPVKKHHYRNISSKELPGSEITSPYGLRPEPFMDNNITSTERGVMEDEHQEFTSERVLRSKMLEAETRYALRNKLNLNLVRFSELEKQNNPGSHQTLYNTTITYSSIPANSQDRYERRQSPPNLRLKKRLEKIGESSSVRYYSMKSLTAQSPRNLERNRFEPEGKGPAAVSNILDLELLEQVSFPQSQPTLRSSLKTAERPLYKFHESNSPVRNRVPGLKLKVGPDFLTKTTSHFLPKHVDSGRMTGNRLRISTRTESHPLSVDAKQLFNGIITNSMHDEEKIALSPLGKKVHIK